jgi:hypothetical protein
MKLHRLAIDVVFLAAGAGVGIIWGVHHPIQAQNLARQEHVEALKVEAAAAQAKIDILQKFGGNSPTAKQMLSDEQQKLDTLHKALTTQPSS